MLKLPVLFKYKAMKMYWGNRDETVFLNLNTRIGK
jgi:hypothetical protein